MFRQSRTGTSKLTHQVFARDRNVVAQDAQLGATDLRMDTDLYELFVIQGADESAFA